MELPKPGTLARLFGWLRDAVAMPGILRRLDEARAMDADARVRCLSCGFGRIGNLVSVADSRGHLHLAGRCDQCHRAFELDPKGPRVLMALPALFEDQVPHD
jgi:hypothetical protein